MLLVDGAGADGGDQLDMIVERGELLCDVVSNATDANANAAEIAVPLAADAVGFSGDVDGGAADDIDGVHPSSSVDLRCGGLCDYALGSAISRPPMKMRLMPAVSAFPF